VTVVLLKKNDSTQAYDFAVASTDTDADLKTLVSRYADRWSVKQSTKDSKILIGAADAANRLRLAVQRGVPFAMLGLTVLVVWYAGHGSAETDLVTARARAPWNRKKTHVSVDDMLIAFRRAQITAITGGQDTLDHYPAGAVTSDSAAAQLRNVRKSTDLQKQRHRTSLCCHSRTLSAVQYHSARPTAPSLLP
jgi:hypothetical protein